MSKPFPLTIIVIAVSLLACMRGICQSSAQQSTERMRIARPAESDATLEASTNPQLRGSAEQHEIIDPPFSEVPGLTETPPIKGEANPLNWLLMPSVGESTFSSFINETHPDFFLTVEKYDESAILEMVGEHEKLGPKARLCGVVCRRIKMDAAYLQSGVTKRLLAARPPKVLIYQIGCSCSLDDPQAVKRYVENGGYLIVTGRDLHGIEAAFPDRITGASGVLRHDKLVDARLYNPDQILCANLVTNARWYIPNGFVPIKVLNPKAVRVVCTSGELAADIPDGQGVLAAIFPYGRGYVLCLTGLLDNTTGNTDPALGPSRHGLNEALPDPAPKIRISLRQGLAINFIDAAFNQKRIPINGEGPSLKRQSQNK
jgi:hypothetical protein